MNPAILLLFCTAFSQDVFEVATIKAADPYKQPIVAWRTYPGGRIVITNFPVNALIGVAYGISEHRITGGPDWAGSDLFDITAIAPPGSPAAGFVPSKPNTVPPPEFRRRMQGLLRDRFGLKLHRESRELPVLTLVVGKGGPKFQPASDPSAECDFGGKRPGELEFHSCELSRLIGWLEPFFRDSVVDATGLTGKFDFNITYAWNKSDADRLPLDRAVETQLGLVVKTTRQPVEFLVIDDVKKPSHD